MSWKWYRRLRTAVVVLVVAAIAAVVVVYIVLPPMAASERGRALLLEVAGKLSGTRIAVADLEIGPGLKLRTRGLRIGGGDELSYFTASRLDITFSPLGLLLGRAREVTIDQCEVFFDRIPPSQGGGSSGRQPFEELRLGRARIHGLGGDTIGDILANDVVIARDGPGSRFVVRGNVAIPSRSAAIEWKGAATPSGEELEVEVVAELPELADMLASLAVPREYRLPDPSLVAKARVTGDLFGALDVLLAARLDMAQPAEQLRVDGKISLDGARESAMLDLGIRPYPDSPLVRVRGPVEHVFGSRPLSLDVVADLEAFEIGTFSVRLCKLAKVMCMPAAKWISAGSLAVKTRVRGPLTGVQVDAKVVGDALAFHDPDYFVQGAGLVLQGSASMRGDVSDGRTVAVNVVAAKGELLYGQAYLDVGRHPLRFAADVAIGKSGVEIDNARLALDKLANVNGSARINKWMQVTRASVRADVPALDEAFDAIGRDTLAIVYPIVARTNIGGAARADLRYEVRGSEGFWLTGLLQLRDVSLTTEEPRFEVAAVQLDLPVDLRTVSVNPKPRVGRLVTGELTIGKLILAPISVPIMVNTNTIELEEAIRVPLDGGAITLAGVRAGSLMSDRPTVLATLAVESVSLGEILRAAELPVIEGMVNGMLDPVAYASGRITTGGELRIDLFGGELVVDEIMVDQLSSSVPSLHLDATATNIDLRRATESLGLGYVSGIAGGKIEDLEIAAGQPVAFRAAFETVDDADVPQRISVAAIDQLTILGGASSSPASRGVLGLFDEYRYKKMGFRCSLHNDRFVLHGVAEDEGKDLLVVGTWMPPTVNVVSHNQTIAFREMVSRLERIASAGSADANVE